MPLTGALFGIALLLQGHRYVGINHDSILYLGQGMARHWPEIFKQDLFFLHGSQDRYSVFPWLIDQSLSWFSPPRFFLWGAAIGLISFYAASWLCLKTLLPPGQRYWTWLGTICLPSVYGVVHLFSFGEKFFTPRPFAEALCLLVVALLTRRHTWPAWICLLLAGILHPLQAIGTGLIVWPWLVLQDKRWLHAVWLGAPVLMAAIGGIKPFSDLFLQIDPIWRFNLNDATPQLFLSKWQTADFKNLLFDAGILLLARPLLPVALARWCCAALIGLAMGYGLTAVLVDGAQLALPAALQLWRAHWIAHWFALVALVCMLHHAVFTKELPRALLLTLAATYAWGDGRWEWLACLLLYACWPRIQLRLPRASNVLCALLFSLLLALLLTDHVLLQLQGFKDSDYQLDIFPIDRLLMAFPVLGLGLPLLFTELWSRLSQRVHAIALLLIVLPLALLTASHWDSRGLANRIFENTPFNPDIFGPHIPETAQIFWYPGSIMGPWLVLQRASYFSPGQVAGEIFNRGTAIDARGRIEKLRPLIEQGLGCDQARAAGTYLRDCSISARHMHHACAPDQVPAPDFLVLPYRQSQPAVGHWDLVDPEGKQPGSRLWLYRCSDILKAT